jgi:membrane-bound ClpP family serine protease
MERTFARQRVVRAASRAPASAGSSIPMSTAMIVMTTSSSISVKAPIAGRGPGLACASRGIP